MFSAAPLAFAFARATAGQAQTPPSQAPALTQQQINEEMLKELKAIHQLLEKLTTPQQQPQTPPQPTTARVTNLTGAAAGRTRP